MEIDLVIHEVHPRREFRIARPRREPICNVFVRLQANGRVGWGEASPNAFYRETADGVCVQLRRAQELVGDLQIRSVQDIERAWTEIWRVVAPSRAAQCALDLALWDWLAREQGVSVSELAWGRTPEPVRTFCTIGLSTPEELPEKVDELHGFPLVKIKSDSQADLAPVEYICARNHATIAVDANGAWSGHDLGAIAAKLKQLGVAFIEQPLPPEEDDRLPASADLPMIADESCVLETDVARVAGRFAGFNIKLVKCGGLTPALRMARHGQELGLTTMVGCMLESSVLIAAGAVVAQRTDYADLDGAWLLRDDPFCGWTFERGTLHPPGEAGLGVAEGSKQ